MKYTGIVLMMLGLVVAIFGVGLWAMTLPSAEAAPTPPTPAGGSEAAFPLVTLLLPVALIAFGIGVFAYSRGGGWVQTKNPAVRN